MKYVVTNKNADSVQYIRFNGECHSTVNVSYDNCFTNTRQKKCQPSSEANWYSNQHHKCLVYDIIQILTGHERYSQIYLARGSEDIYYLPEANGRGKIVDVLTPEGQIDLL